MKQNALTLLSPVQDDKVEQLRKLFQEQRVKFQNALGEIDTIHYARWVIVDGEILDGEKIPTQLVFSSNFDGDFDPHFNALVATFPEILDEIYTHCESYVPSNKLAFLKESQIKEAAFYKGAPERSVQDIKAEKSLHEAIANEINAGNWKGQSAVQIHKILKEKILTKPEFSWAKTQIKTPKIKYVRLAFAILVILAAIPFVIIWAIYIQIFFERKDKPLGLDPNQLDGEHLRKMELDEDFYYQNQFSQIINMKPGKSRSFTVNGLYLFTRVLVKLLFVKGKLMGIPTIHYARWVQINDKKRMLFFSNFDGSWTQYLGDFIDKSGWGLTGIFSNTEGFPRSKFLFFKGAYDERKFLAWARYTQIQTQVWYSSELTLSIKNINNNTIVRNLFSQDLNEKKAQSLLARI
jgi:hypothetical protein